MTVLLLPLPACSHRISPLSATTGMGFEPVPTTIVAPVGCRRYDRRMRPSIPAVYLATAPAGLASLAMIGHRR